MQKDKILNPQKYIFVFLCSALIFAGGFLLADFLGKKNMQKIDNLQQNFRIDILSLETQFSILSEAPCDSLNESTLTQELYEIAQSLENIANNVGPNDTSYIQLKKYYSILEIRHWLMLKKAKKQCRLPLAFVIYFYTNKQACADCANQGFILTHLRKKYPELRVYSFDYDLDLSALNTLKSIYKIKDQELPLIVINDKLYQGYKTIEELEEIIGKYIDLEKSAIPTDEI